jgi:cell wall-associated NlpC family hydrolase
VEAETNTSLDQGKRRVKPSGRADDRSAVRRFIALTTLLALVFVSAAAARPAAPSWAQAEIRLLISKGLMPKSAAARPDEPVTLGEVAALAAGLSEEAPAVTLDPQAPVTIAQLNAKLVGAVGLSSSATRFLQGARVAGLKPPSRFGTEVVARLLGLRTNHPAAQDTRELRHDELATREEAAFSAAQVLKFRGSEVEGVKKAAATFGLPALDPWQKRLLATAVGRIGLPYIWAGTSDSPQAPLGVQVNGGFDCSGFAWRVFKQPYPGGAALTATMKGRSAAAMAGEVPPAKRIAFEQLRPADLVFFGPSGPRSKPGQVDHMGVALGNGWMIHSSRHGVAVVQLTGWYRTRFAWGRRPLAEAGLAGATSLGVPVLPPGIR